jgi:TonB family protein
MCKFGILAMLSAFSALAASLTITVLDPSGGVVPKAGLVLVSVDNASRQEAVTGAAGEYTFHRLPAGKYQLEVSQPGFMLIRQYRTLADANADLHVYAILRLGAVVETVEVAGAGVAPTFAPGPRRVRVGGNVQPVKLISAARPQYPESAKARGARGTVLLNGLILQDGTLGNLRVMASPDPDLASAALTAVRQWRYQPALLNGQPVEVETTVSVNFQPQR